MDNETIIQLLMQIDIHEEVHGLEMETGRMSMLERKVIKKIKQIGLI